MYLDYEEKTKHNSFDSGSAFWTDRKWSGYQEPVQSH